MRRVTLAILVAVLACVSANAQLGSYTLVPSFTAPSGPCVGAYGFFVWGTNPTQIWGCPGGAGTWTQISSGGGPPSGGASGDLSGSYPGPTVAQVNGAAVPLSATTLASNGSRQIVAGPTALPPNGSASGDLGGSYPGPTVAQVNGAVVPLSATTLASNGSRQIVAGPTALPPNGSAGGQLAGSYPSPNLAPVFGVVDASIQTGALAVNKANTADTAIGAGTGGIMSFPTSFGSGLDFWQNASSTWSDLHCVKDNRTGTFSALPANDSSIWGVSCLRTTDPSSGTIHESGGSLRTYWMGGGVNGNLTPKSVLQNMALDMEVGGTSIGQHYGLQLNDAKHSIGDMVNVFTKLVCDGNFNEQGGEGCESTRLWVTQGPVMTGTVSTNTTGVIVPSATTNYQNIGIGRLVVKNPASPFYSTGTITGTSISTGVITVTFTGSSFHTGAGIATGTHGTKPNASLVNVYYTDLCLSPTDLDQNGQKAVFPVISVTDDTHLTVDWTINSVGQTQVPGVWTTTGAYRLYQCATVTSVAQPYGSGLAGFTLDTTQGYTGWAAADLFEVPEGYQFRAQGLHITMQTNSPYSAGQPTAGIAIGSVVGSSRPLGAAISVSGQVTRGLTFDTAMVDDHSLSSTCLICVPSAATAFPFLRVTDGTNPVQIFVQPAATSGNMFESLPSTNGICIGTTGGGCFWTATTNTGATSQSGTLALASTADLRFTGGTGQHIRMQAAGNDVSGTVTVSASTTGTHSFTTNWTNSPSCTLTPTTDPTATGVYWVTTSTTTLTATVKVSGTITFNYLCVGNPN